MMKIEVNCEKVVDKEVKAQTHSGVIYLPCSWIGSKVKVLMIEKPQGEEVQG